VQRVFLGFSQAWASKYRDKVLHNRVETDSHSPSIFRTDGSVRNVPECYQASDVKEGDARYLAPANRVKLAKGVPYWGISPQTIKSRSSDRLFYLTVTGNDYNCAANLVP
jgi:hypothetical protein